MIVGLFVLLTFQQSSKFDYEAQRFIISTQQGQAQGFIRKFL